MYTLHKWQLTSSDFVAKKRNFRQRAHRSLLPSSLLVARVACRLSRRFRAAVLLLDPLPKKAVLPPLLLPLILPKAPLLRKLELWLNAADMTPPAGGGKVGDGHERVGGLAPGASAAVAAAPAINAPLRQAADSIARSCCDTSSSDPAALRAPAAVAD